MTERTQQAGLNIASPLYQFINQEVLPGTGIEQSIFWQGFSELANTLAPLNRNLLATREQLQSQIDQWHRDHQGEKFNFDNYKNFLKEIGYLAKQVDDFTISTTNVDPEMATLAGPQLVVPIMNARFALNAANARWGSLYDALYGTDAISEENGAEKTASYNPVRGEKVIAFARDFLDQTAPLASGSYHDAKQFELAEDTLLVILTSGAVVPLKNPAQFKGYQGSEQQPSALLFTNNGLHFEIQFDDNNPIAQRDKAGISDILMEAALSTIMDCEDSVAAVDGEDKIIAYKNWLGLIKGDLSETVIKGDKTFTRTLNDDRQYLTIDNQAFNLKGRSLMFVRNVGHLMTNNAILLADGSEIPEGILDAVVTSLISLHDLKGHGKNANSTEGSIYIVKPKMHGPDEVDFANILFGQVEQLLGLEKFTMLLKNG
jgi:malate synthase